ncbi:S-acyl fatty acid synthase thioesterase, medium chain isoform X1 [Excalfactoria chinensis]|uniref:S-acyl fatty acid synthase thioesterase, medium chain isoform X1 n=2 Tax=Excalfactoria chinensis TaxID=46218 RepID=UPI003B3BA107
MLVTFIYFLPGMEKAIVRPFKRPNALCRLICFPWAGGGTSHFAQWGKLFSSSIEVSVVRLPGRESRAKEPFAKDMTAVINEITSALLKDLQEKPFAFFGHSFGAYISYAVAVHLKEKHGLEPIHLFLSGVYAPHSEAFLMMGKVNEVKDEDILEHVKLLGGTPSEFLSNEDIRKHLVLTVREDVSILQTYSFEKAERKTIFSCDVTCFDGSEEAVHNAEAWLNITKGDTSIYSLPGAHFYLLEPANEIFLIKHITKCIENAAL